MGGVGAKYSVGCSLLTGCGPNIHARSTLSQKCVHHTNAIKCILSALFMLEIRLLTLLYNCSPLFYRGGGDELFIDPQASFPLFYMYCTRTGTHNSCTPQPTVATVFMTYCAMPAQMGGGWVGSSCVARSRFGSGQCAASLTTNKPTATLKNTEYCCLLKRSIFYCATVYIFLNLPPYFTPRK